MNTAQLEEMRKAASLVEAPNSDKKPGEAKLKNQFSKIKELKKRNEQIVKAYKEGYSQQMIAKVLGVSQQAIFSVIKRSRG